MVCEPVQLHQIFPLDYFIKTEWTESENWQQVVSIRKHWRNNSMKCFPFDESFKKWMELKDKEGISVHDYLFLLYLALVGHI